MKTSATLACLAAAASAVELEYHPQMNQMMGAPAFPSMGSFFTERSHRAPRTTRSSSGRRHSRMASSADMDSMKIHAVDVPQMRGHSSHGTHIDSSLGADIAVAPEPLAYRGDEELTAAPMIPFQPDSMIVGKPTINYGGPEIAEPSHHGHMHQHAMPRAPMMHRRSRSTRSERAMRPERPSRMSRHASRDSHDSHKSHGFMGGFEFPSFATPHREVTPEAEKERMSHLLQSENNEIMALMAHHVAAHPTGEVTASTQKESTSTETAETETQEAASEDSKEAEPAQEVTETSHQAHPAMYAPQMPVYKPMAHPHPHHNHHQREVRYATCVLQAGTQDVAGEILFRQEEGGYLQIGATVTGLSPGLHGFHVHTYGDVKEGCASMAGHYNPMNTPHGAYYDPPERRHVGDFKMLEADAEGKVDYRYDDYLGSLFGDFSIIGRGVVVHAGEDDLGRGGNAASLLAGNAGSRAACCTIAISGGPDMDMTPKH